jgi:hypothetical protein
MPEDHQVEKDGAQINFPGKSKRAGSTSGDENYGGTKEQKVDPTTQASGGKS